MEYYITDKVFEELALTKNCMSKEQINRCKLSQKKEKPYSGKMLHEIALEHKFIHENDLEEIVQDNQKNQKHLLIGGYQIRSILGEGGLGVVYLAKQISMKRNIALKVLYRKWVTDEEFRKRFLLEARIVGKLSHPNLIQVFDVGFDKGHYYFSMEYVPGYTIEQMVQKEGCLSLDDAIDIVIQLLDALSYVWEKNLVHRDIKPSNIIIKSRGTAKLGDFGFVKSQMDEEFKSEEFVLGTPDYMSPEQAMGSGNLDYQSDIYSLGGTLYYMVTGSPPYQGTESVVIRQHIKAAIPSPRTIVPHIPEELCFVIEKMMAKEALDRYQDYEKLKRDLLLVKEGKHPTLQRLDVNKSTIAREEDYFGGASLRQVYSLEREVRRLRYREIYYQVIIAILCAFLIIALLLG